MNGYGPSGTHLNGVRLGIIFLSVAVLIGPAT
jgi:hypothetical protein